MRFFAKLFGGTIILLSTMVIIAIIFAVPIMFLWNWLMPDIFGLPTISIWQAIGINFLSSMLFQSSQNKGGGEDD